MSLTPHILIVGQGLAGTVLSFKLRQRNIAHKVMDNGHKHAATGAAAGIINPITGRRYVKSWMIDELLPEAQKCYSELEKLMGCRLINSTEIIRTLPDAGSENDWEVSTMRPGYDNYTGNETGPGDYAGIVANGHSYRRIKQALQVDISGLIRIYRELLIEEGRLISGEMDYKAADLSISPVRLHGQAFSHVIFCEGYRAIYNPWFKDLPFQPSKGEALYIDIKGFKTEQILRDDIFLVPLGSGQFWSGGGYAWEFEDDRPEIQFREQWMKKLDRLLKKPYALLEHKAGIRPSVKGRRPFLGKHPEFHHLVLFNGLGTKGTSLAPYFADQLCSHLFEGGKLSPEVDIYRFYNS